VSIIISRNPSNNSIIGKIKRTTKRDVSSIYSRLKNASALSLSKRIKRMLSFADEISNHQKELSSLVCREIGRPITEAQRIQNRIPERIRYLSKIAPEVITSEVIAHNKYKNTISKVPIGIVFIISSWNYPIDIPLSSIVPALLAGNQVIFKPSEYASISGQYLSKLLLKYFENSFAVVYGDEKVAKNVIDKNPALISLTGKTSTAKKVLTVAKPLTNFHFNLTGKDSMIVLDDVEVVKTAEEMLYGSFRNNGASCSAIQRAFIPTKLYDEFITELKNGISKYKVGSAEKTDTIVGPIRIKNLFNRLTKLVSDTNPNKIIRSAQFNQQLKGTFFPPTIIEEDIDSKRLNVVDIFGPILVVHKYSDIKTVLNIVNSSTFGLTSSIYSKNISLARKLASSIEVGQMGINSLGRSFIDVPWVATKDSGSGIIRSKHSILEFVKIKVTTECDSFYT